MSANFRNPNFLLPNEVNMATNPALSEDRHSLYSMEFDGNGDYIDCGDNDLLSFGNGSSDFPFTISAWVYIEGSSTFPIFDKYPDSGSWSLREYRMLEVNSSNQVFCTLYDSSATARFDIFSDSLITRNQWEHLCITYDGRGGSSASDGVKIYINGVESTKTVNAFGTYVAMENKSTPVRIGRLGSTYAEGKIDEVALFRKELSDSEVSALTTANAPANILALSDKPVAYWPLGEQARDNTEWQFPNQVLQSQVFDFDGSTDYISVNTNTLGITTAISISSWIRTSSTSGAKTIICQSNRGTRANWVLGQKNNYIQFGIYHASGNKFINTQAYGIVSDNKWHNIVGTWDGTTNANTMKIYIDGNLAAQGTPSYTGIKNSTDLANFPRIGATYDDAEFFDGELSNIVVWDTDQSLEKDNIYNNGSPASSYTNTPTAWYKLNATNTYAGLNPNFHNALDFSGSNQNINLGNETSLYPGTSDMSYSFWFKSNSLSGYKTIFSQGATDLNALSKGNKAIFITTLGDELRIFVAADIGAWAIDQSNTAFNTSNANFVTNKWYHIVFTFDRDGDGVIYVNGVANVTQAVNGSSTSVDIVDTDDSIIGGVAYDFDGQISNFALFTQAISAEDVLYLYNGGTPQTNISFEPTSWYKLDNLTTGIQDSGSASNNGTNSGATAVSSSVAVNQWNFNNVSQSQTPNYSSVLSFDDTNDYIDCGNDSSLQISQNISVSCWFKCTTDGVIISKGQYAGEAAAAGWNYFLKIGAPTATTTTINWSWYTTSSEGSSTGNRIYYLAVAPKDDVTDGNWHNIVATRSSTGSSLWLDGVYIANNGGNVSGDLDYMVNSSQNVTIGTASDLTNYFGGELSNIQIWNTVLTEADALSLYNSGTPQNTILGSPQAWWKLDSTTITDSSGNGNTGTNNGATEVQTNVWTPRLNGESDTLPSTALVSSDLQFESPYSNFSLDFDGTGNYIDAGAASYLSDKNTFTISTWFNTNTVAGTDKFLVNIGSSSSELWGIQLYNSLLVVYGGSTAKNLQYSGLVSINTWYNLVLVFDGGQAATDRYKVYLNGLLLTPTTPVGEIEAVTPTFTNNLTIGKIAYSAAEYWNGKIDETAIWSSALTQAQVSQIYNNGYAADLTSLSPVSWWRLGEDAYFVGNDITIPNQISGAPNGTGAGTQISILVANAPGSYASGVGTNLADTDRKGEAPESSANSQSINMIPGDVHPYTPGYAPAQVSNVASMNFDGINDYFDAGNPTELQFTGAFSVSFWMKGNLASVGNRAMISKDNNASNPRAFSIERTNTYPGGYFVVYDGTTPYGVYVASSDANYINIGDNNWHHIVGVYTPSTSVALFVDGNFIKSNTTNIPAAVNFVNDNLNIGRRPQSGGVNYFPGDIDEVAVFDYALSPKQIKQDIYDASTTGKTADLNNNSNLTAPVAWYRMGD